MLKNCFSLRLHCRRSCFPYNNNNNNNDDDDDDDDDDDELY